MTDIAHLDTVICGDCLEVMKGMPDNCIDTIITDPPYGLGFMGKDWDTFKQAAHTKQEGQYTTKSAEGRPIKHQKGWSAASAAGLYDHSRNREFQAWFTVWAKECLRVAKPGTILMAFGGTRTYHRLTCAIEDAGWEIRDCIQWIYGSGFPKSLDISKAIDKAAGAEREVVGDKSVGVDGGRRKPDTHMPHKQTQHMGEWGFETSGYAQPITAPATELAQQWDGWGTALKPSWEPIIVAMKPLDGTYAQNAEKWGVAGLWIDGGRIGTDEQLSCSKAAPYHGKNGSQRTWNPTSTKGIVREQHPKGRFPSNTILSCTCEDEHEPDCPVRLLDEQSGDRPSCNSPSNAKPQSNFRPGQGNYQPQGKIYPGDSGGASRFFYCAKSSRAERNAGCEGMEAKPIPYEEYRENVGTTKSYVSEYPDGTPRPMNKPQNHHPTVKPLALMEYLCKLTKTPTGGIVLDPFGGSGSTGIAAYKTNRHYILIEKEADYCKIAEKRIQDERDKYPLFDTAKGGEDGH